MFKFLSGQRKSKDEKTEQRAAADIKAASEKALISPLKAQETIRILMLPVGEPPVVCTIEAHENTYDFKGSFDFLVNGKSDLVYLCRDDGRIIFLGTNDIGKLIGLAPNRYIFDGRDVLVGQAFVVAKLENGSYCDLTDKQIDRYKKQFAKFIDSKDAQIVQELLEKHAGIYIKDENGDVIHNLKIKDMQSILSGPEKKSD